VVVVSSRASFFDEYQDDFATGGDRKAIQLKEPNPDKIGLIS
jgi:hypothetical protein